MLGVLATLVKTWIHSPQPCFVNVVVGAMVAADRHLVVMVRVLVIFTLQISVRVTIRSLPVRTVNQQYLKSKSCICYKFIWIWPYIQRERDVYMNMIYGDVVY